MKAIILAAGYATRLYPLTLNCAKPLLPVGSRPMIDYLIDQAVTLPDLDEIYVVSNHRFAGQFEQWAEPRRLTLPAHMHLHVIDDQTTHEDDRLGAIGDIQYVIRHDDIDDDLLVMAGDNLFTWALLDAWQHFRQHSEDMILAQRLNNPADRHRFAIAQVNEAGLVEHLEEKPACPRSDIGVYAIYFYRRDTLPLIGRYLEEGNNPDAPGHFPTWLYQQKPVRVFFFNGTCIDIGTPEAYEDVMTTFPVSATDGQQPATPKAADGL
ncbi:MAG: nucleotidyltransferase family protein [Clostridiaceae bacterium]|nr:nucleotidyltransferase family protein [Clostridiaceae bacterium]